MSLAIGCLTDAQEDIVDSKREKIIEASHEITGASTTTTLFENFNTGRARLEIDFFADYGSEEVTSATGEIGVVSEGGDDGSPCLLFGFQGELGSKQDTDLAYYLNFHFTENPLNYEGVHVSIKPNGFSVAELFLKQTQGNAEVFFFVPIILNTDEWQDLVIPFSNFFPLESANAISGDQPLTMSIAVLFQDNYHAFHFRDTEGMRGSILVDNLGFYKRKYEENRNILDTFEDEISRIVLSAGIYGSSTYMDYTESEGGIERVTPGIRTQRIVLQKEKDGPFGSYMSIRAYLDVTKDLEDWLAEERSFSFNIRGFVGKTWENVNALSFSLRSKSLTNGMLELMDYRKDRYYYVDLSVNPIWTRLIIPVSELITEGGTLAETEDRPLETILTFTFDVPRAVLLGGIVKRSVELDLDFDEFILMSP